MKKQFIKTSDEHTANLLRDAGYVELAKEGNRWVFINDTDKLNYASSDKSKMIFENKLCV